MGRQKKMNEAKVNPKDEWYTLREDIEKELRFYKQAFKGKRVLLPCDSVKSEFTQYFIDHFKELGLESLTATWYAGNDASDDHGGMYVVTRKLGFEHDLEIQFSTLIGNGDFLSDEITAARNEADVIVTNPPFSKLKEFMRWIWEGKKEFLIIAPITILRNQEVFPRIMSNEVWTGTGAGRWISGFKVPDYYTSHGSEVHCNEKGERIISTNNCLWLTNLIHEKMPEPLQLMTLEENLRKSKHKRIRENGYQMLDGTDILEVPFSDAIPSDYLGRLAVPITFLLHYDSKQFEILGLADGGKQPYILAKPVVDGNSIYTRVVIRRTQRSSDNELYIAKKYSTDFRKNDINHIAL